MNEIIASILEAESKADDIVKLSADKAALIRRTADDEGEKIKNGAVAVFKIHKAAAIKDAENRASEVYDEITRQGKEETEKLYNSVIGDADAIAAEIVKGIIG